MGIYDNAEVVMTTNEYLDSVSKKLSNWFPGVRRYEAVKLLKDYYSWQYNGVDKWNNIEDWCNNHFNDDVLCYNDTIYFKQHSHYVLFLLRWS